MTLGNIEIDPDVVVHPDLTDRTERLSNFLEGYLYQYLKENYSQLFSEINVLLSDFADDKYTHAIDGPFTLTENNELEYNSKGTLGNFDPSLHEDGYIETAEYNRIEEAVSEALQDAADSYDPSEHQDLL